MAEFAVLVYAFLIVASGAPYRFGFEGLHQGRRKAEK